MLMPFLIGLKSNSWSCTRTRTRTHGIVRTRTRTHEIVLVLVLTGFENQVLVLVLDALYSYSYSYSGPCTRTRTRGFVLTLQVWYILYVPCYKYIGMRKKRDFGCGKNNFRTLPPHPPPPPNKKQSSYLNNEEKTCALTGFRTDTCTWTVTQKSNSYQKKMYLKKSARLVLTMRSFALWGFTRELQQLPGFTNDAREIT